MNLRALVLLFLLSAIHLVNAQTLDWSRALVPPQGPLPVRLWLAQGLSDGSVFLAGEASTATLTGRIAQTRVWSRVDADGNVAWVRDLGVSGFSQTSGFAGSSFELPGNRLALVSASSVVVVDQATGASLWETRIQANVAKLLAGPDNRIYVLGAVSDPPFLERAYTAMLDGSDGAVLWSNTATNASTTDSFVDAATLSGGDLVAVKSSGELLRISASDGSLVWRAPPPSNRPQGTPQPVAIDAADRVLYFHGGSGGGLEVRAASDGALLWRLSEAVSLQGHTPRALHLGPGGRVITVSEVPGPSRQVHVRSFRTDDGSESWRVFLSEGDSGPRFVRSTAPSPDTQQLAVLLADSPFASNETGGVPGKRLAIVNVDSGSVVSATEFPQGNVAQFTEALTWTNASLSLAGIRAVSSSQPALLLTRFNVTTSTLAPSLAIDEFDGYSDYPIGGIALADAGGIAFSRRGGIERQVFALTRFDELGQQIWRTEYSPATGTDWYWLDALQVDATGLIAVLGRDQLVAGQVFRIDIETGRIDFDLPVFSVGGGGFRPTALAVNPSGSRFLLASDRQGGRRVSWHDGLTGEPLVTATLSYPLINVTTSTFREMRRLNDGGVLVLTRVRLSDGGEEDFLHRLDENGQVRWTRMISQPLAELTLLLVDESIGQARLWGRSGPPPFFTREVTVSLVDGAIQSSLALECPGSGTTSSGWVSRLGTAVVHLVGCSDPSGPDYRIWSRQDWNAAPVTSLVSNLAESERVEQVAAEAEGRLNLILGSTQAGQASSLARLHVVTGRTSGRVPLRTSSGQQFSEPRLIGPADTALIVASHLDRGRVRVVVAESRDMELFGDGFED